MKTKGKTAAINGINIFFCKVVIIILPHIMHESKTKGYEVIRANVFPLNSTRRSIYVSGKLPIYPSPKLTFYPE